MTIKQFKERVSVRDFSKKKFTKKELKDLVDVINNSPTSTNSQQFSAIIVTDEKTKQWISAKNWYQKHIADAAAVIIFVADRTRINNIITKSKLKPSRNMVSHEFMRGVVDATIAATYAHDALITMGYGTTFIGGPLTYANDLHKKLNLPDTTMVVVGLSVGYPNSKEDFKPKMNKVFMEKYNKTQALKDYKEYNPVLAKYYAKRNVKSDYVELIKETSGGKKSYDKPFGEAGKYVQQKLKDYK